jgi:hypothetical protein
LLTIGAHSQTHRRLATSRPAARALGGREREQELSRPVRHLAYPERRAGCVASGIPAAADAGYLTAVTTRRGKLSGTCRPPTVLPPAADEGPPDLRTVRRALSGTEWFMRRGPVVLS